MNRSLKILSENTVAKRDPHRSQGDARQERKETRITESNNSWEVKTIISPFWVQNLSWCVSIQVNLIWKDTYLWTCTKSKQNQFSFRFFTEAFKTENVIHQPTRYIFHKTLQCEVPSLVYIQFINSLPKSGGMWRAYCCKDQFRIQGKETLCHQLQLASCGSFQVPSKEQVSHTSHPSNSLWPTSQGVG